MNKHCKSCGQRTYGDYAPDVMPQVCCSRCNGLLCADCRYGEPEKLRCHYACSSCGELIAPTRLHPCLNPECREVFHHSIDKEGCFEKHYNSHPDTCLLLLKTIRQFVSGTPMSTLLSHPIQT